MKSPKKTAAAQADNPKPLNRTDFARKLYNLMLAKGWRQSELARRAGLPRDSISTYIRGKTLPTSASAVKLAKALGVEAEELLPYSAESNPAVRGIIEVPSIGMTVNPNTPNIAFLQVNRNVSTALAVKIIEMVRAENGNAA